MSAPPASEPKPQIVPDSEHGGLMSRLPGPLRDYAALARFDRPIGFWLLFWPCAWGLLLAGGLSAWGGWRWDLLVWLLVGSVAMRGAGCVWNDLADADIDARVERTRLRPVASGRISRKAALAWTLALCLVGLIVLLQLRREAQAVALASLALVAAYPFMKRITGWPQAWLGLVFTWGAPVGWVAVRGLEGLPVMALLYAGAWGWCVGYDTIYACQDREDDALVGIGSSALSLGGHVRLGVAGFYALALAGWGGAFWLARHDWLALLALAPVAAHLGWQVLTLRPDDGAGTLRRFRANHAAGALMALACWVVGSAGMM